MIRGVGDDQAFGSGGGDRMIWNPGDDTDLDEGGAGVDTVEVNGGNGAEQFAATANGARVRLDRLDPAPFSIDVGTSENVVLDANGGDDSFSATGNPAALVKLTVDGGPGDDTLLGGNGADVVDGNQGADVAQLGAGDDTSGGIPATRATPSRDRTAATRCGSTATTSARSWRSPPTGPARP